MYALQKLIMVTVDKDTVTLSDNPIILGYDVQVYIVFVCVLFVVCMLFVVCVCVCVCVRVRACVCVHLHM